LGGGAGTNMGEGGDSIGGSNGKGICVGGEDQGDNGDAGGEDIARSLTTSKFVHAGIVWAFKICLGRSKPMVITKARTLNGGSRSFLLKASATAFAFPG
nr:hypothetical protein [Tanacetum cinerariifolium]